MDGFYPKVPDIPKVDDIDEPTVAAAIIAGIETGEISKEVICGKVLGGMKTLKGVGKKVYDLYDRIEAEKKALDSVSPAKYKTEAEFQAALKEAAVYGSDATWYTKLKEVNGVTTWDDLKEKYTPEDIVAKEI